MRRIFTAIALCLVLLFVTSAVSASSYRAYTERVQVGWGEHTGLPVYCNIGTVSWLHMSGYLGDGWEPIAIWQPVLNSDVVSYKLVYHESWDEPVPARYGNMTESWYEPVPLIVD